MREQPRQSATEQPNSDPAEQSSTHTIHHGSSLAALFATLVTPALGFAQQIGHHDSAVSVMSLPKDGLTADEAIYGLELWQLLLEVQHGAGVASDPVTGNFPAAMERAIYVEQILQHARERSRELWWGTRAQHSETQQGLSYNMASARERSSNSLRTAQDRFDVWNTVQRERFEDEIRQDEVRLERALEAVLRARFESKRVRSSSEASRGETPTGADNAAPPPNASFSPGVETQPQTDFSRAEEVVTPDAISSNPTDERGQVDLEQAAPPVASIEEATGAEDTEASTTGDGTDGRWADLKRQDNERLQVSAQADAVVGPAVGMQYVKPDKTRDPIFQILGVGADGAKTYDGASAVAEASQRPVVPITNSTGIVAGRAMGRQAGESVAGQIPFAGESLRDAGQAVGGGAGAAAGWAYDVGRSIFDRSMPAGSALEPSTKTLAGIMLDRVVSGKSCDVVAHSQGTVISQNAAILVENELAARVKQGRMSEQERSEALARIHIVSTGAFAPEEDWPQGIRVTSINNPDDPVSSLGGWVPWFGPYGQDVILQQSHDFVRSYARRAGERLRQVDR